MGSVSERISFIRGLMEGLKMNKDDETVKILDLIVGVLDSLNETAEAHEAELAELNDYVESIDDDLAELEMEHDDGDFRDYDDEDDEEIIHFSAKEPVKKRGKLSFLRDADEDEEDDDDDFDPDAEFDDDADAVTDFYIGCVCPECGKFFSIKNPVEYDDEQKFICPFCKKKVGIHPMDPSTVPAAEPVDD